MYLTGDRGRRPSGAPALARVSIPALVLRGSNRNFSAKLVLATSRKRLQGQIYTGDSLNITMYGVTLPPKEIR